METLLASELPAEGGEIALKGKRYVMRDGILRSHSSHSATQAQTQGTYAYLWSKLELEGDARSFQEAWFEQHFPGWRAEVSKLAPAGSRVLDAGCGAGWSALAFFGEHLRNVAYIGADISTALERAAENFRNMAMPGNFVQESLTQLPFSPASFDFIFTPGVLHHTDSVKTSLKQLAELLVPGGKLLLWVYRKQPPLREFADRLIRNHLAKLTDEEAFRDLMPLTRLGDALGRLNVDVDVPEDIPVLGIPKGRINLQRLVYYYFVKTFYNDSLSLERANMQNFDWYRPLNAHTSTLEEVQQWCALAGLTVEWHLTTPSGISALARKK
ncbi:MAG: methyltransferase domain-containing protein [Betaproteobacteria bacterium]|nr:methyltransferase domain-containing protein [Betaproteobacteria bacterium]